jgi:hypothetical protein
VIFRNDEECRAKGKFFPSWKTYSHQSLGKCPINCAGSDGRCNTIWYKAVFKGGVYEAREKVWAFGGAEERGVASLEGRADIA